MPSAQQTDRMPNAPRRRAHRLKHEGIELIWGKDTRLAAARAEIAGKSLRFSDAPWATLNHHTFVSVVSFVVDQA